MTLNKKLNPPNIHPLFHSSLTPLIMLGCVISVSSVWAGATVGCNVGLGVGSTECGVNADASGDNSTASGYNATASGGNATAIGYNSSATNGNSLASGRSSKASGVGSTAVGNYSRADSFGSVSLGYAAGLDIVGDVTSSDTAIAIGHRAIIGHASPGAIAIGGDLNGDLVGAQATAPGAIALGKDVHNDVANSMLIKVPFRIESSKNQLMLLDNNKNTVAIRNVLKMSNLGPVGFEMEDTNLGNTWQFRSNPDGKFIINRVGNPGNEFLVDGAGNGQFAGEVTANGMLLTSSRASKTDISDIQPAEVMEKLKQVEVAEWRYKKAAENDRHIGPMAEDFYALFQFGRDGKTINPNDLASVALVAAKELQKKAEELQKKADVSQAETQHLKTENKSLKQQLLAQDKRLNQRLSELEKLVTHLAMGNATVNEKRHTIVLND